MLATHVDIKQQESSAVPNVRAPGSQHIVYTSTVQESPFYSLFERDTRLPADIMLGLLDAHHSIDYHEFLRQTRGNTHME